VIEPGAVTRRLYLPRGSWYDFWTGERSEGGRQTERKVDLATLPLYVRAGAILPIGPARQYVSQPVDKPLTVRVYPGADGQFALYEDDGASFAYERGQFLRLDMQWNDRSRQLKLALAPGSRMFGPAVREIEVEMATGGGKKNVRFNGGPIVVQI
jgi:alpha-glucosidase (family GH31 glycosyl hydrolase)